MHALLIVIFFYLPAHSEMMTINSTARALGMGDAFLGLADDASSLHYNPAGLARVSGLNLKIFSLRAGASGVEAYTKIKDLNGGSNQGYADALSALYGEHVWTGAGGDTAFTMPMIGFGVYDHLDALIQVDNPVYPEIYTSVINDYGYVLGFGVPILPVFHLGTNLKYVKRTGARVPYGAAAVADLQSDEIYKNVTGWGTGYGVDLGANLVIPAPFFSAVLSGVWKNVGEMKFRSGDPNANIPTEKNDLSLGVALNFDMPLLSISPAIDVRYLNREDLQLTRKLNFGIEIGIPLLDIRGGFHEGYYTAGLGVNLGLFKVDVATYGVELGAYPGQIEDRRYVLEFSMELGVGGFTAPALSGGKVAGTRDGGSDSGGSGGGGGGRKSFWGGRKLKQRR